MYVCHSNSFIPPPLNSKHNDAAIDIGCSTHTWPLTVPVHNFQKSASSAAINVKLPNDQVMAQSHHGTVPMSDMPSSVHHVKIILDHSYKPLLSLGQLTDSGYKFQGDNNYMILTHISHQRLITTRCPSSGMYLLSLINPHSAPPSLTFPRTPTLQASSTRIIKGTQYLANNTFSMSTNPDLAMYYHRALLCLVPSTFITAINNGNFSTWPGLTVELIAKHLPKILATAKGHAKLV